MLVFTKTKIEAAAGIYYRLIISRKMDRFVRLSRDKAPEA